jgi:hypothetical protein
MTKTEILFLITQLRGKAPRTRKTWAGNFYLDMIDLVSKDCNLSEAQQFKLKELHQQYCLKINHHKRRKKWKSKANSKTS